MANKPYYGVNPAYNSSQTNEMVMGLPGAMTDATVNMLKKAKTGLGNVWNSMDTTSKAATVVGLVPGIGDAAGLANDARLFYQNPEMRTPMNYGLSAAGLIPGIPSMAASMGMVKGMGKGMAGSIVPPVDVVKSIKPKPIKAPASDVGFYSPVEKAALNLNRNQGSGQSFLNDLKKGDNVKGDELTYTELEGWLKTKPNLTKQEVQDYIANNKLDIQESYLDDSETIWSKTGYMVDPRTTRTQHGSWQLPNGDNYREILLTLPNTKADKLNNRRLEIESKAANATDAEKKEWSSIMNKLQPDDRDIEGISKYKGMPDFQSTHWDEPNVLAHIRTNQRLDTSGRKTTLIEEVQSDWHQAGREKGYNNTVKKITPEEKKEWRELDAMGLGVRTNVQEERLEELDYLVAGSMKGVPDAPFKEDWYKLALKRAIKEAVDNGSDSISLTTGSRQAERYSLSKKIHEINYNPTTQKLWAYEKGAFAPILNEFVTPEELSNRMGKELAEKLLNKKLSTISTESGKQKIHILKKADIEIGGEGMKKYYDEIYPAFLNKFGKKYGVKVEDNIIDIGTPEKVYTLPITPKMREDALKGQPLTDKNEQDKNQYYA